MYSIKLIKINIPVNFESLLSSKASNSERCLIYLQIPVVAVKDT